LCRRAEGVLRPLVLLHCAPPLCPGGAPLYSHPTQLSSTDECVVHVVRHGSMFVVTLCKISTDAIDAVLEELLWLQDQITSVDIPMSDFVYVDVGTNSSAVCAEQDAILQGSFYMLISGPVALTGQIIMLTSYIVASNVSWRHLKDLNFEHRKADKLVDRADHQVSDDGMEMRRQQIQANSRGGGSSGPGSLRPPTFDDDQYNRMPEPGFGGGPPPFNHAGSFSEQHMATTQDI
jgi:hypothetical protein